MTDFSASLGAVYTQRWAAELLLDRLGYVPDADLAAATMVEPCCGDGAFAVPIVKRLLASARRSGVAPETLHDALVFVDIDPAAVAAASGIVAEALLADGVAYETISSLLDAWMRVGDFLTTASALPTARWVVGNPPYLRVEDVPADRTRRYRTLWRTMWGRADIYVGFWEAGLSLLEPGGRIGYVCADRWMRNQYGERLRTLVAQEYDLLLVLEMHDVATFQSRVEAYPAMVVIGRPDSESRNGRTMVGKLRRPLRAEDVDALDRSVVAGTGSEHRAFQVWPVATSRFGTAGWTFPEPAAHGSSDDAVAALPSMPETGVSVRGGLATGADDAFILAEPGGIEEVLLRPIVGPTDLVEGELVWSGRRLLYPWTPERELIDLAAFPGAGLHLAVFEERLRNRHVVRTRKDRDGWWRTIDREPVEGYVGPALLIPDIRERVEPVLDVDERVPMHSLYRLTSDTWDLEVLGAVLMSDLVHRQMKAMSVAMASGRMRVSAQYLRRLRIPAPADLATVSRELAEAFRDRDRRRASNLIDAAVTGSAAGP